jgi:D-alanyl-D-alanine carboxypeptidase
MQGMTIPVVLAMLGLGLAPHIAPWPQATDGDAMPAGPAARALAIAPPAPSPGPSAKALPATASAWDAQARRMGLPTVAEAAVLSDAGRDCYGRPVRLSPGAKQAWLAMRAAARASGISLDAISGFRTRSEQAQLVRRKLQRGMPLEKALTINAAPGFSEHHAGNALDIGTPGSPAAEEEFERTAAFRWLSQHAREFGFAMSYPRNNQYGIAYEPWHWNWHEGAVDTRAVTYEGEAR